MKLPLYLCCILLPLLASCFSRHDQPGPPAVLATINGAPLKEDNLRYRLYLHRSKFDGQDSLDPEKFKNLKESVFAQMVENRIILDWGKKAGITLAPKELAEGIIQLKEGYTEQEFELMLGKKKVPYAKWSEIAEETLTVQKIVQTVIQKSISVSDAEMAAYYHKNSGEFRVAESVRVRHIVTDTVEKAKELHERAARGENFAKLAIMHSLSPDKAKGGDLGYFSRGTHPEEFDKTCFTLGEGEISPVVQTPYGFHIFKLIHKEPAHTKSFAEVQNHIKAALYKEKMNTKYKEWFAGIKKAANISIMHPALVEVEL